jgi:hypothetical protein
MAATTRTHPEPSPRRTALWACGLALALAWSPAVGAQPAEPPATEEPAADDPDDAAPPDGETAGDEPTTDERSDDDVGDDGARDGDRAAEGDTEADDADDADDEKADGKDILTVNGYVQPSFNVVYRPDGLPRDELDYQFRGRAGLIFRAEPFDMWSAIIHFELNNNVITALTDVDVFVRADNNVGVNKTRASFPGTLVQQAAVKFQPIEFVRARAGFMRIPFTSQQQSANNALLFPERSTPNEVFLSGADLGALAEVDIKRYFIGSVGVFSGDSLGLDLENAATRGVVVSFRGDVNPFGEFDAKESDIKRGPFRLGVGFGTMLRPTTIFDDRTGTEARSLFDVRIAASLRMAYRGLYFGAEYFRRVQTDDFSFRPQVADGAYGQVAFFIPVIDSLGLEPIARAGFVAIDQTFDPRLVGYTNAGVNVYPIADPEQPDAVRLTLQYLGERRFTEEEDAHGAGISLRLKF